MLPLIYLKRSYLHLFCSSILFPFASKKDSAPLPSLTPPPVLIAMPPAYMLSRTLLFKFSLFVIFLSLYKQARPPRTGPGPRWDDSALFPQTHLSSKHSIGCPHVPSLSIFYSLSSPFWNCSLLQSWVTPSVLLLFDLLLTKPRFLKLSPQTSISNLLWSPSSPLVAP